jgi:hypothetical protein
MFCSTVICGEESEVLKDVPDSAIGHRHGHVRPVRNTSMRALTTRTKLARFLKNHDKPRAASTIVPGIHETAAITNFVSPGSFSFHQGQFAGLKKRTSPQPGQAPEEPASDNWSPTTSLTRRPASTIDCCHGLKVRDHGW